MSSNEKSPYMIRHPGDVGDDEWVSPEPADEVITDDVVAAGDLEPDDIEALSTYVDLSELSAVLDGADDEISFAVEGHDVVVRSDGTVDVTVA